MVISWRETTVSTPGCFGLTINAWLLIYMAVWLIGTLGLVMTRKPANHDELDDFYAQEGDDEEFDGGGDAYAGYGDYGY